MTRIRTEPPTLANPEHTVEQCHQFIEWTVADAHADGAVINLSGGIDSTVTATLAAGALGSDRVTGLILPTDANRSENMDDAIQVAEELVIDYRVIEIQELVDAFSQTVSTVRRSVPSDPMQKNSATMTVPVGHREYYTESIGNAAARMRMMVAYFEANTTNRLVIGTGNRTEILLGYFTKYGDGAADLLPIADLYKNEVRQLGRELGVRDHIISKDPTAGLWAGQADETELGASYELIDTLLWNLVELDVSIDAIADHLEIDHERIDGFEQMLATSTHKRRMPPQPSQEFGPPERR